MTPVSITQPNGPGKLPLTIIAQSAGWQLKHVFTVNSLETELVDTVTIKRLGGPLTNAALTLNTDDAPNNTVGLNMAIHSNTSTAAADSSSAVDIMTTALITTGSGITTSAAVVNFVGTPSGCNKSSVAIPATGDYASSVSYLFNTGFNTNASKTVKFKYLAN
jgi:hypothetical protein